MSLYQIMKSNALEAKRLTGKPAQTSASWYKGDVPTANEALAEIYRISRTDPDAANNLYEAFSAERDMPSSPFYNPHTKATNDSALKIISSYGIDTSGGAKKVLDDNAWLLNYATYSPTTGAITQGKSKESKAAYWYAQINDAESLTQSAEQEWAALQDEIAYWASRDDKNLTDEEILQRIDFSKYKTLAKLDESKANASPELLNRPIGYSRDNLYGAIWAARNGRSTGNPEIDSIYYTIGEGNSYKPNLGVRNYLDASKPTYDPYRVGSTMDSETYQFRTSGFDDKWLQENAGLRADEKYKTEYERIYNAEQNTKAIEQEIKGGYTIKGDGIFTEDTVVPSVQEYINTLSTDALWGRMTYDDVLADFKKKYPGVYDLASGIPAGNIYNTTRKIDFDFAGLFAKLKNKVDVLNARKNAPTSPDARDTASKAEADANISATGTATVPPEDTAPKSKTGGENLWDMIWNGVTNWMAPGFKDFVEFATQTDTDAVKPSDTEPDKSSKLTLDKSMRMAGTGASDIGQSAEAYSLAELNQQLVTANTQLEAAKVEYNRTRNPIDYEAAQSKVEALKKQIADYGKADMQKAKDAENKAKLDKYNAIKVPDKYGDRSYQDFKDTPDVYERSTRNMGKQEYVQPTYDKWIKLSWFEPKIASTMTETEIDRLEYLYELDPEKARGYYEALSQTELNTRYRAKLEGEAYATGKKDPVYATLYNLVNSIFKGTAGVFNILDGWFNGEIELNDPRFASVWESESTQRGVTEDMGSTGKFLYGVGMSIGENVIGRALLGPYALVTMAGSAANASYSNAIDRGVPQKDALLYGTIVGGLEAATERLQFKYFEKILKTGGREGIKGFFTGLAQSMLQEGSEEIASEIGGFLADTVIAKDKALILDAYAENLKIANGNEQEAWAATVKGFFSDVAMAGVGGAVSGGFFELVGRAGHRIKSDIIKSAQVEGSANTRHATRESRVETKPVATPQEVLAEVVQSTQAAPNTQESALRQEIQTELQHIRDLKNAMGEMDEQARLAELDAAAKRNQERLVRLQGMRQSKQAGSQAQRENESEMAAQSRVAQQSTRAASQSGTAQEQAAGREYTQEAQRLGAVESDARVAQAKSESESRMAEHNEQAAGREYTQEAQRLGAVESDARVAQAKSESESRMAEHNEQASAEETAADGGDVRQNVETIKRKVSDLQMSTDALEREMAPDAQPAQQEEIALDTKVRATFNIDNGAFSRLFAFVEGSSKTDKSDVQTVAGIAKSISEMPSDTALRIVKSYIESNASLEDAEAMAKVLLFAKAINPDADLASADALIKAALVDRTSAMVASQPIPSDMYLGTTATVIATTGKNATSIALERWGTPGLLYIAKLANSPNEKVRRLAFVLQTMDPSSKSVIVAEEQMKTQTSLTSEQEQAQIDAYNEDRRNPVIMADAKKRALNQAVRIREAELMSENFIDNFKSKADEKVSYAKSQLNESQKMLESAQSELDAINDAIKQVNSGEGTVPSDNEFKKALVGKQLDAILKVELGKMAVEIANINVKSAENDANNWKEDSQLALSARALSDVLERANAAFYKWMDTYRRAYEASKALAQAQQATSAVVEQIVNNVPVDPKALESATAAESDAMQAQLKAKQDADKAKADAATAAEEVSKAETAARAKEEAARAQARAQAEQEVRQRAAEAQAKQADEAAKAAITEQKRLNITQQAVTGNKGTVYTNDNVPIQYHYALVPAEGLSASNNLDLSTNPAYPADLQPRDRTRDASAQQIQKISRDLNPERLGESSDVQTGAPIVGSDYVVESGNGRVIAIQSSKEDVAKRYTKWLQDNAGKFGFKAENVQPGMILVRVRDTEVDRQSFVRKSNESPTGAYSPSEMANSDAGKLTPETLNTYEPNEEGNINTYANRPFILRFLEQIIPASEKGRYITADGLLSQDGISRIRNALFQRAYGSSALTAVLSEDVDNSVKNVIKALTNIAPRLSVLNEQIKNGQLYDINIAPELLEAVNAYRSIKFNGTTVQDYLSQFTMYQRESETAQEFLQLFDKNKRSAKAITETINRILDTIQGYGDPNQISFNKVEVPSKLDIVHKAVSETPVDPQITMDSILNAEQPAPVKDTVSANYASKSTGVPVAPAAATGKGTVQSAHTIFNTLGEKLNVPLTYGKKYFLRTQKAKGALAYHTDRAGTIFLLNAQDMDSASHDFGHHMDKEFGLQSAPETAAMIANIQSVNPGWLTKYDPSKWNGEAIAEFFKLYMLNPSQAKVFSGDAFFKAFEDKLKKRGWLDAIREAQNNLNALNNASIIDDVRSRIWLNEKRGKLTAAKVGNTLAIKSADYTLPLLKVTNALKEQLGENYDASKDPRNMLLANASAANNFFDVILKTGLVDPQGKVISKKSLNDILKVNYKDEGDFNTYWILLHSLDRLKANKGILGDKYSRSDIEGAIAEMETRHPEFKGIVDEASEWYQQFMQAWVVDTGLLDPGAWDRMKAMYPHYIPTYRVREDGSSRKTGVKGLSNLANGILAATKSDRDIKNPVMNLVQNIQNFISKEKAAEAGRAFSYAIRTLDNEGAVGEIVQHDIKSIPTSPTMQAVKKALEKITKGDESGLVMEDVVEDGEYAGSREKADLGELDLDAIMEYLTDAVPETIYLTSDKSTGNNVINILEEDGSYTGIMVHNKDIADAILQSHPKQIMGIFRAIGFVTRIISKTATAFKATFTLGNALGDLQTGLITGSFATNPATAVAKWAASLGDYVGNSVKEVLGKDASDTYRNYQLFGKMGSRYSLRDQGQAVKFRKNLYKGINIKSIVKAPISLIEWANEVVENVTRYAEYKYGKHDTSTYGGQIEAGKAAREVTTDFSKRGVSMSLQTARTMIPFLGATIEGAYKTARIFSSENAGRRGAIAAKGLEVVLAGTLMAIAKGMFWRDEDKENYELIYDDYKQRYIMYPNGDGTFTRIKKSQDTGIQTLYAMGEVIGDYVTGNTDDPLGEFVNFALGILKGTLPTSTAFSPISDVALNRTWNGSPIESNAMQEKNVCDRYYKDTPFLYRSMSQIMVAAGVEWSPLDCEYITKQYFGEMGTVGTQLLSKVTEGKIDAKAVIEILKGRFVSAFSVDPSYANEAADKFYGNKAKLEQVIASADDDESSYNLRANLTVDELNAGIREAKELLDGPVKDAYNNIKSLWDEYEVISKDETYPNKEAALFDKRLQIVDAELSINQVMADYAEKYFYPSQLAAVIGNHFTNKQQPQEFKITKRMNGLSYDDYAAGKETPAGNYMTFNMDLARKFANEKNPYYFIDYKPSFQWDNVNVDALTEAQIADIDKAYQDIIKKGVEYYKDEIGLMTYDEAYDAYSYFRKAAAEAAHKLAYQYSPVK